MPPLKPLRQQRSSRLPETSANGAFHMDEGATRTSVGCASEQGRRRFGSSCSITAVDMRSIIKKATACEAYLDGVPRFGGTCWRVTGRSLDEIATVIGVEVYVDHLGKRLIIVTVF